MIGLPPSDGAVKVTVAWALPAVAVTLDGASGTMASGITELEGAEGEPVPAALVAVTVKV